MPRPRGTGLNVTRARLADGSIREYYYNRRTGENLGCDRAIAEARLEEKRAIEAIRPGWSATLAELITDYLHTDEYRRTALRTQKLYRQYLDEIRDRFGTLRVRMFDDPMVARPWIKRLKADLEDRPRKANQTLAILRILGGQGVEFGYCKTNPFTRPGRVTENVRREIWTAEQIAAFIDGARGSLRLAMMLLIYTAQRPADVLAMTKGHVSERDGRLFIALRQQKTGELLDVPVHTALEPLLRARMADPSGGLLLVPSPTGLPWAYRNFSRAWDKALANAGLTGQVQRRDLRRTAVVLMAEAGLTTGQISSLTGHQIDSTARILNTYLPRRPEVALAAMKTWENTGPGKPLSNVVSLAAKRPARGRGQKR